MPRTHRTRRFEIESSSPSSASGEQVLGRIRRPETWPEWQSEIIATRGPAHLAEGDVVDGDARLLGFDVTGRSSTGRITEERFEQDVIVGVRMRVSFRVTPAGSGSIVTHRMEADLPSGVTGSVLSMLLAWRLKRMQNHLLRALSEQAGS